MGTTGSGVEPARPTLRTIFASSGRDLINLYSRPIFHIIGRGRATTRLRN